MRVFVSGEGRKNDNRVRIPAFFFNGSGIETLSQLLKFFFYLHYGIDCILCQQIALVFSMHDVLPFHLDIPYFSAVVV
jgi:hypothetical protein